MKLIIQIPCFNEAKTLPVTLAALPRVVEGFDVVEWLVIDDGSSDGTAAIAKAYGVDHVIRHAGNKGLAKAFITGIDACLQLGADVIVNTDADNQYDSADIPELTRPILEQRAELVIGARPIAEIDHFSPVKKILQRLGSWVVRVASKTDIPDAPSGFRAMSRAVAQRLMVFGEYTYTLETILQAGQGKIAVSSVKVRVNEDLRPSRLVRSIPSYIGQGLFTITRIFIIYRPFLFFGTIGTLLFSGGFLIGLRFLLKFLNGDGHGHVQSLILASCLISMGFVTILMAFLADLMSANRKLLEDIRVKTARLSNVTRAEEHPSPRPIYRHAQAKYVERPLA